MFGLQCLIHPCPQFTHMHNPDQCSQSSQFRHMTAGSLLCFRSEGFIWWYIIYTRVFCAHFVWAGHSEPQCQGSPRASCLDWVRKAEVKTSNFGSAIVLVWLCLYREVAAPLALPHCHPQNQGRRRTVSFTQLSLWHAVFILETEADLGLSRYDIATQLYRVLLLEVLTEIVLQNHGI